MNRVKNENDTLHFQRPRRDRIAGMLAALLYAGTLPASLTVPGLYGPMDNFHWINFGFLEVIGLTIAALALSFAGADDLSFDFNHRTYRYVAGWPLRPQIYAGPWEDMAAICLLKMNQGYLVGIAWKDSKMRSHFQRTILGRFNGLGRRDHANKLAQEIAGKLDVPLVEQTSLGRSSRTMS